MYVVVTIIKSKVDRVFGPFDSIFTAHKEMEKLAQYLTNKYTTQVKVECRLVQPLEAK